MGHSNDATIIPPQNPTPCRIVEDIHDIFQPMYQVQVCASTCTICTSALSILFTINDDIMYALRFLCFLLTAFFQLLFWCWAGERTFDMSVQINRAAYTSNWVDLDVRQRLKVSLVLMRSQRALEFTSDPFYVLNYESFSAVVFVAAALGCWPVINLFFVVADSERFMFVLYDFTNAAGIVMQ